ncbi:carbon-nitrogen hydrolase [Bacillus freudenreichii]|nr:carbon-nitrogen hydrolase [Bacillus freudenreichii]
MPKTESFLLRKTRHDDIEEIVQVSNLVFGPEIAFIPEELESQLSIFPEGQVCLKDKVKDRIVGFCSSLIVNFEEYGINHSLDEITDNNFIRNHDPKGKTLYGFDVTVHPDYRGMGLGRKLYEARQEICRTHQLDNIMFGGRIPNFHKYADKLSVNEYIDQVIKEKIYDPVLTFQLRNGFNVVAVMENYLPDDHESLKYATLMEWINH